MFRRAELFVTRAKHRPANSDLTVPQRIKMLKRKKREILETSPCSEWDYCYVIEVPSVPQMSTETSIDITDGCP